MIKLEATFRIVTPIFMGGANPNQNAELREPSIKGALRYWYRAIDENYKKHEAEIFGGTGKVEGQALFLLRVIGHNRIGNNNWSDGGREGLKYLSFPFNMRQSQYMGENMMFTIRLIFKKTPSEDNRRRVLASLWLLGHIGGIGSRSRRGFGTISLDSITTDTDWRELADLPILSREEDCERWANQLTNGFGTLREWFSGTKSPDHAVFGSATRFKLIQESQNNWRDCLDLVGRHMMGFRRRYILKDPLSDYHRVRDHICAINRKAEIVGRDKQLSISPKKLTAAPDRAAFGLPLTFRYRSLEYEENNGPGKNRLVTPNVTFQGEMKSHGRSASRIHFRVIKIGNKYYPLVFCLDGPLLSIGEQIKDNKGNLSTIPSDSILGEYWNELPPGKEVAW